MTNRQHSRVVKHQRAFTLAGGEHIHYACQCMGVRQIGAALVSEDGRTLKGTFNCSDEGVPWQSVTTRSPPISRRSVKLTPEPRARR